MARSALSKELYPTEEEYLANVIWEAKCAARFECGDSSILNPPIPEEWLKAIQKAEEDVADARAGERRMRRGDNVIHVFHYLIRRPPPPPRRR